MKHIRVLGITGGVGAGKSTVLDYMDRRFHARVIQLDKVARGLMEPGQDCYKKVVAAFGQEILNGDGTINRQRLYERTFSDREQLESLNAIVHPMVKEAVKAAIAEEQNRGKVPFVVLEAALLLEDGYDQICDSIWYIYVEEKVREKRLRKSRGYTPEKVAQILKNQKTDEEFRSFCQFVVDNSSDIIENTYEQIDRGLKKYGFL